MWEAWTHKDGLIFKIWYQKDGTKGCNTNEDELNPHWQCKKRAEYVRWMCSLGNHSDYISGGTTASLKVNYSMMDTSLMDTQGQLEIRNEKCMAAMADHV